MDVHAPPGGASRPGDRHRALSSYRAAVTRQVKDEEEVLFPLFEDCWEDDSDLVGDGVEDNRKALKLLQNFNAAIEDLDGEGAERRRQLVELLDRESAFKMLMERRRMRDETVFYPALDRSVETVTRQSAVGRCQLHPVP